MNPGIFSSKRDDWETPQALFDLLDTEFEFTLDPCATAQNAKCKSYFTKEDDGLHLPWSGSVFVNPPYGREIANWVHKSYREAWYGANIDVIVMLIPARTDTRWWHDYVMKADEVWLIKGRVRFSGRGPAPFPSAIVIFRPNCQGPPTFKAWRM